MERYRYRAYPTGKQAEALARVFGCTRAVFDDALTARQDTYHAGLPLPTAGELSRQLITEAKKRPERAWLAEVSAVPLQQALADAERAYRDFFDSLAGKRKGRRAGIPRFRAKRSRQTARFTANAKFTVTETTHGVGFVRLPKIGRMRFALSRPLPATPSSVTVIQEADGRHYLSFVVDVPAPEPLTTAGTVAGVHVGLVHLAVIAISDGTREKVPNPRWLRSKERALARAQRSLDRKKKGSKNRVKAHPRVAVLHRKVRETRPDHHHKLVLRLVRENQTVALEGLHVAGLCRSRLSKSVHDAGWAILARLIRDKATTYGREVRVVDRWHPTSQVCSVCGTSPPRVPPGEFPGNTATAHEPMPASCF